jgi:hypothetical protein
MVAAIATSHASAQPTQPGKWRWIWVAPDYRTGWRTFEGYASVKQDGQRFEVTIDGVAPDEQPSLRLVGTVIGTKITAIGTLLGTDASPERYVGSIQRERTKLTDPSNGWGSDRMVLRAGPTFIGLYRDVRSTR